MRVPDFLVRQFYVKGSLQPEGDGFRLQAQNGMGNGTLVGIGTVTMDGQVIDPATITASRAGDETVHRASDVSRRAPVTFNRGDIVTFHIAGHPLAAGAHKFEVDIYEVNLGLVQLSLKDLVRAATA